MRVIVHSAAIQDRDGAGLVLDKIRRRFPWLELVWADGGYNAWQVDAAVAKVPPLRMEIVKRSDDMKGFVVLPRRWVVERTFSWFGRNRRLAKDFENLADTLATFVTLAPIQLALRRLARAQVVMMKVCKARDSRRSPTHPGTTASRRERTFLGSRADPRGATPAQKRLKGTERCRKVIRSPAALSEFFTDARERSDYIIEKYQPRVWYEICSASLATAFRVESFRRNRQRGVFQWKKLERYSFLAFCSESWA